MTVVLHVEQAGFAAVQDLGRPGHGGVGIAGNGAADAHAARLANTLVGNAPGRPLVEVTGSAYAFTSSADVLVAVTGAAERVSVGGAVQPAGELLTVPAGSRVTVEAPARGWRSYVAVNGLIDSASTLGSVAPDSLLGVGTRLSAGDTLTLRTRYAGLDHPHSRVPVFRLSAPRAELGAVDVTAGPELDEFGADALDGEYEVSPQSDQVGLRLLGPAPERSASTEILSRGVPVGAVEVPPGGGLLVLLRGRLVTAGYPVIGVATTVSVDRLGQVRPRDTLTFSRRTNDEAVAALRRRDSALGALAVRVRAALTSSGIGHVLDDGQPP
ncbi:MAG: allophanate hydrolase [Nocardioidaceae bacterium]|nr:allophanate hydrolase [Nocardioidaceae bacterium]